MELTVTDSVISTDAHRAVLTDHFFLFCLSYVSNSSHERPNRRNCLDNLPSSISLKRMHTERRSSPEEDKAIPEEVFEERFPILAWVQIQG